MPPPDVRAPARRARGRGRGSGWSRRGAREKCRRHVIVVAVIAVSSSCSSSSSSSSSRRRIIIIIIIISSSSSVGKVTRGGRHVQTGKYDMHGRSAGKKLYGALGARTARSWNGNISGL